MTETFPLHVVTAWLGNSQLIAAKHYLQVTDSHFQEAAQNPTQKGTEMSEPDGKTVIRPIRENEKGPVFPGLSASCTILNKITVLPRGVELSQDSAGNSRADDQGDSQSDSLVVVSDPRLARLIEVWPALADDVKGEMLTLAGLRSYDVDDFNDVGAGVAPIAEAGER